MPRLDKGHRVLGQYLVFADGVQEKRRDKIASGNRMENKEKKTRAKCAGSSSAGGRQMMPPAASATGILGGLTLLVLEDRLEK